MKKLINRVHRILSASFLYLSPIGVVILIIAHFNIYEKIDQGPLGSFLGILFLYWFLSSLYVLFAVIFNREFRESIFIRLAGIKERDEREEQIVGKAMKSSFLFTLGLLVFLLAFSTTRSKKNIDLSSTNKVHGSFTIGHLEFKGLPIKKYQEEVKGETHHFEVYDIPLSKTSLILVIILAQIFSYHIFARTLSRD